MRMWGINPGLMCSKHLLGEHVEMHMFIGAIKKGKSIQGYIDKGLVNTDLLYSRHFELAEEMIKRGMKHNSTLPIIHIISMGYIDKQVNLKELLRRCPECRKLKR